MGGAGNEASIPDFSIGDGNQNRGDSQSDAPRSTGACRPPTCASVKPIAARWATAAADLLQCGTCSVPESCGGGGFTSQCGQGGRRACRKPARTRAPLAGPSATAAAGSSIATSVRRRTAAPTPVRRNAGARRFPNVRRRRRAHQCGGSTGCVPQTCAGQSIDLRQGRRRLRRHHRLRQLRHRRQSCGARCARAPAARAAARRRYCASRRRAPTSASTAARPATAAAACSTAAPAPARRRAAAAAWPSMCGGSARLRAAHLRTGRRQLRPHRRRLRRTVLDCGTLHRAADLRRRRHPERLRRHDAACRSRARSGTPTAARSATAAAASFNCGTCTAPDICGGGGVPSQCGGGTAPTRVRPAPGLCHTAGQVRRRRHDQISGTVFAPTPRSTSPRSAPGPDLQRGSSTCRMTGGRRSLRAGCLLRPVRRRGLRLAAGQALTGTGRQVHAHRTSRRAPTSRSSSSSAAGAAMITHPQVTACQTTRSRSDQTRLPRKQAREAATTFRSWPSLTGDVDTLECVLRKIGIDDAEFTIPANSRRVHILSRQRCAVPHANGQSGARADAHEATLYGHRGERSTTTTWCSSRARAQPDRPRRQARPGSRASTTRTRAAASSPRTTATSGSTTTRPFCDDRDWNVDQGHPPDPLTGIIDSRSPRAGLRAVARATWARCRSRPRADPDPRPRHDFDSGDRRPWRSTGSTRRTPATVAALHVQHAGRRGARRTSAAASLFSDFHVERRQSATAPLPDRVHSDGPLTPQEKVLEFMLFDLASCIEPDKPAAAADVHAADVRAAAARTAARSATAAAACSTAASARRPQTCGGGGSRAVAAARGVHAADVRAAGVDVRARSATAAAAARLRHLPAAARRAAAAARPASAATRRCIPRTCAQAGHQLRPGRRRLRRLARLRHLHRHADAAAAAARPACAATARCVPKTCARLRRAMRPRRRRLRRHRRNAAPVPGRPDVRRRQADGGPGMPNNAAAGSCTPLTCAQAERDLRPGRRRMRRAARLRHVPHGSDLRRRRRARPMRLDRARPLTCAQQNAMCGPVGDGCGGQLDCGTCTPPDTCGGGGVQFVCGHRMVH